MRMHALAAFAAVALATPSLAATQIYRVKDYPGSRAMPDACHQLATDLGARFTQMTGATLVRSICEAVDDRGYDVKITYDRETPLNAVSTIDALGGVDAGGGIYDTRAACEAALPREQERFENATGLDAFVGYCFEDVYSDEHPFAIRVDAFGDPAKRPYSSSTYIFGTPSSLTRQDLLSTVKRRLVEEGVDVSYVRYEGIVAYGTVTAMYYAERKFRLETTEVAKLPTKEACAAALPTVTAAFASFEPAPIITLCSGDGVMGGYEVVNMTLGMPLLVAQPAVETYRNQAACEADRARVVTHYRDTLGRAVEGGICSLSKEDGDLTTVAHWEVVLFERP